MAALSLPNGDHGSREWLQQEVALRFERCFGYRPSQIVSSPGRVNLIGEHVDYNQGVVLPMAVNRYTAVALAKRADSIVRVYSTTHDQLQTFDLTDSIPEPWPQRHWLGYIIGTLVLMQPQAEKLSGFDIVLQSTLPLGAGLSSSASLTTAIAKAVQLELELALDWKELARRCQQVEHRFLGVPCGLMDQWACLMTQPDHLLMIDFQNETFRQIPWLNPHLQFLVINSGIKHQLVDGHYAERQRSCRQAAQQLGVTSLRHMVGKTETLTQSNLDPVTLRRASHVISEIERTLAAVSAIQSQQWTALGQTLNASHASLRDQYEVSCPEVDLLVDIAQREPGILGARMTGGGFGGSTINLVEADGRESAIASICNQYYAATGVRASAFCTAPM